MMVVSRTNDFLWKRTGLASVLQTTLMTAFNTPCEYSAKKENRVGIRRMIKHNLKIDMTPMVDLGFLLISFFVITTELSKPTTMDLFMPKDGKPMDLGDMNALTILLDNDNTIWYYHGSWEEAEKSGSIVRTGFSGNNALRRTITVKQKWLDIYNKQEGRNGLMLLVKPASGASYKNIVDVLDEVSINLVKKYALMKPTAKETDWLQRNR
ncbi:MAG: biopolymer transporter ExbD [Chitinophagaceae bacterium]|nr:biopolymer transporter ExbD [Chitinophagaceae bacterium]